LLPPQIFLPTSLLRTQHEQIPGNKRRTSCVAVKIDRIGSQSYFWLSFFSSCDRLVLKPQTVSSC
ncbi:hypothetical protein CGCVW01_v009291, partial [Colletotrichum viniferum]